jgi:hypothetical protein
METGVADPARFAIVSGFRFDSRVLDYPIIHLNYTQKQIRALNLGSQMNSITSKVKYVALTFLLAEMSFTPA